MRFKGRNILDLLTILSWNLRARKLKFETNKIFFRISLQWPVDRTDIYWYKCSEENEQKYSFQQYDNEDV